MLKWKAAVLRAFLLIFISHFALSGAGYDYDYEDQKVDSWSRCPWIRNKLKNGRVRVRSRGRIAKFICKSGYELVGKKFATCVRGQWNSPIPVCVTSGCPRISAIANGAVSEKYKGAQLTFSCNPGYGLLGDDSIFCDGTRWDKNAPKCQAITLQPQTSCDFEDPDLCGWTHDPTHDFDWRRHQFKTPSGHVGTGPSYDHTFGRGKAGYYMYEEASAPRNENDTSRLYSPVYSRHYTPGCFVFWYHMYGATIGWLRVYVKPESHVFVEVIPSWEKYGDQGNQWLRGNVTVPLLSENFQIVIEGIRGTSYVGDTAIDDVGLLQTDCSALDSSNTTGGAEASMDSCRGRCHEEVNSTSCGCTDACEPNSTCCSDYAKLCVESSEPPSEDESATAKSETDVVPEEKVGTEYIVTPPILSTEFVTRSEIVPTVTVNSQRPFSIPEPTTVNTTVMLPPKVTINITTIETATKTTSAPPISVSQTPQNSETFTSVMQTTQSMRNTASEESVTALKKTNATTTAVTETKSPTIATTTEVTPAAVTTAGMNATEVFSEGTGMHIHSSTDSKAVTPVTNKTSSYLLTSKLPAVANLTTPNMPTKSISSYTIVTEVTTNTMPNMTQFVPGAITTAIMTTGTPRVPQTPGAGATESSASTKLTTWSTKVPTFATNLTTRTTRPISIAPTTPKIVPPTTKIVVKSTTFPYFVSPTTKRSIPTRKKIVPPLVPTPVSITTSKSIRVTTDTKQVPAVYPTRKQATKQVPAVYPTKSQAASVQSETDSGHASESKVDVPKSMSSSVTGIVIGVILLACLVGGVAFVFLRRRRQQQSKLRDDSEMRFLPDSEVIEYSDPSVLDRFEDQDEIPS